MKKEKANLFSLRLIERINLRLGNDAFNGREVIFFLATFHLAQFTEAMSSCWKLEEDVKQNTNRMDKQYALWKMGLQECLVCIFMTFSRSYSIFYVFIFLSRLVFMLTYTFICRFMVVYKLFRRYCWNSIHLLGISIYFQLRLECAHLDVSSSILYEN